MGREEFRSPLDLGGSMAAFVYRQDWQWLWAEANEASRLASRPGRPVDFHPADILHALIVAAAAQGRLALTAAPGGPSRPKCGPASMPAPESPSWSPGRRRA